MRKKILSLCVTVALVCTGCGDKGDTIKLDESQIQANEAEQITEISIEDPLEKLSKEELVEAVHTMEKQLEAAYIDGDTAKAKLDALTKQEISTEDIKAVGNGSKEGETVTSFNNRILFENPLAYPGATEAANNGSVNISEKVKIKPSSNWILKLGSASLDLEHTSGISGSIKVGNIEEVYDKDKLIEDVMSPCFKNFPEGKVEYKSIFLDDICWGVQGSLGLLIDNEESELICGVLGFGDISLIYTFCYKGEQSEEKDEAISLILNSVEVNGQKLRVE